MLSPELACDLVRVNSWLGVNDSAELREPPKRPPNLATGARAAVALDALLSPELTCDLVAARTEQRGPARLDRTTSWDVTAEVWRCHRLGATSQA